MTVIGSKVNRLDAAATAKMPSRRRVALTAACPLPILPPALPFPSQIRVRWIVPVAIAGILLSLFSSRRGVGVTPDSTVYLSAARSLQERGELAAFDYRSEAPRP